MKLTLPSKIASINPAKIAPAKERNDLLREWEMVKPAGLTADESLREWGKVIQEATGRREGATVGNLTRRECQRVKDVLRRF